jgi:hypothetical protein
MRHFIAVCAILTFASPAIAQHKATFIDGTYVFAPGACDKLKALAAGGTQAVTTVPWYVTADGIHFWEGGCDFSKVRKHKSKKQWNVVAACEENGEEYTESYIFRRSSPDSFDVTLTTPGTNKETAKPVRYLRCDVGKIPDPQ